MKKMIAPLVLALTVLASGVASADPGRPDHIWKGNAPRPEVCILLWAPVHDAQGNTYGNFCEAWREGARVVWNGAAH